MFKVPHSKQNHVTACAFTLYHLTETASTNEKEYFMLLERKKKKHEKNSVLLQDQNPVK